MDTERPEQYRGVPYLAHVIEPLLQNRRYSESELMAAVIESFFTVFVKKQAGEPSPLGDMVDEDERVSSDPRDVELGPGLINELEPGEEIQTADPKRPSSGFTAFLNAVSTQIGAALEIPRDLLMKDFNKSYSASRAALLEAWKAFRMRRVWFVSDFCRPVYEAWFTEAVASGRVDAPGYFEDPRKRLAWLGAEWTGPSQGQLDPTKEVAAKVAAISAGLETRERATVELTGGNWDVNIAQLARENEMMQVAGFAPAGEGETHVEKDEEDARGENADGAGGAGE
jgi:lambda family phage portal protein